MSQPESENTRPAVSVIIVSWNVADLLVGCLRSLVAGFQNVRAEVIVVDNASVDGSVERIRREFPHVKLVVNEENIGFVRANNLAIKQSRGSYILLLNPDTVVLPGMLESLVTFMNRTPDAGAAGCKQIYTNGQVQSTCHRMITLKRETLIALGLSKLLARWIDYGNLPLKAGEPFRVDWVGGACLIVRRDVMERVGYLDEDIFMYAEDTDLCHRIRQLGHSIYYLPDVKIIHHRARSTSQLSKLSALADSSRLLYQYRGKRQVIRNHSGKLSASLYRWAVIVELSRKLLQNLVRDLLSRLLPGRFAIFAPERQELLTILRTTVFGGLVD